ncbi:hypothetical protein D9Q98_004230 [Chlorella vulgaris]|uniref:Complex 1 LYR protein domain-containing protein n=1 Tax=Chlorella vulgaris TaxID=3077 RepID=A0A9D4YYU7_CHLVU|nr:hypothetical protein D9Q98_004230 [Chlorella vulgaris]
MIEKSHFGVLKLYRDCLRLADYISTQGGSRRVLREQVRQAFKKNKEESDPVKIEEQKEAAVRGLSNYMFHEAQRMAKEEVQKGNDNFDG